VDNFLRMGGLKYIAGVEVGSGSFFLSSFPLTLTEESE
jgi:hypothetical protein